MSRLRRLSLERYGAFNDVSVPFGAGLTVVIGANESGKTTALEGLADFLWGIRRQSRYAFVHARSALRLSAELETGASISRVVRSSTSLREADGTPTELPWADPDGEARTRWMTGFGLSQASLRAGGAKVCDGQGDLAELVFAAATGTDVHALLDTLNREADQLYKPDGRAQSVEVRTRLTKYQAARDALAAATIRADAVVEAEEALRRVERDRDEAEQVARGLRKKAERLERHRRCLPRVHRIAGLRAQAERVRREGPVLTPGDLDRYDTAAADLEEAREEAEQLDEQLEQARTNRAKLTVETDLLADAARVEALHTAEEARRAEANQAEELLHDAAEAEAEAARYLDGLGADGHTGSTRQRLAVLWVADDLGTQLSEHAASFAAVSTAERTAAKAVTDAREELTARTPTGSAYQPADIQALHATVTTITEEGSPATRRQELITQLATLTAARRDALREANALDPDSAVPPAAPTAEQVRGPARDLEAARHDLQTANQAVVTLAERVRDAEAELEALGEIGSETSPALGELRTRRDELWSAIRESWLSNTPPAGTSPTELAGEFGQAQQQADRAADRLLDTAEHRARRGSSTEKLRGLATELESARRSAEAAAQACGAAEQDWADLWQALAVAVPATEAAGDVRGALQHAQQHHTQYVATETELARVTPLVTERAETLALQLSALGHPQESKDLDSLLALARDVLTEADKQRDARTARREREAMLATAERHYERSKQALADWRTHWSKLLAGAELPPSLEATGWIERTRIISAAAENLAHAEKDTAKAQALHERVAGAHAEIAELGQTHQEKPEEDPWVLLDGLWHRVQTSRENQQLASELDARITDDETSLQHLRERIDGARADQDELARDTGLGTDGELTHAADRARELTGIDEEQRDELEELRSAAEPVTDLEALIDELSPVDQVDLDADRDGTAGELAEAEETWKDLSTRAGEKRSQLETLRQAGSADHHAALVQEELAALAAAARRYATVELQRTVLREQLDAYARSHTNELLDEASSMLARLTDDRYITLEAEHRDGRSSLAVRRSDDERLEPGIALSEGTADQVYLALRLAGIRARQRERTEQGEPPLPIVLDDVLTTFDNQRALAALGVLAELAAEMQIILFSHHDHVGRLAEELDPTAVTVSTMPPPGAFPASPSHPTEAATRSPQPERPSVTADGAQIREWARAQGHEVGERGRLPTHIVAAYRAQHRDPGE
jgi:uncharacterized protein YhaN